MTACGRHMVFVLLASYVLSVTAIERAAAEVPDDIRSTLTERGHALVIGVARYDDPAWGSLPSISDDVTDLARGLAPHFATVETLADHPTAEEIRSKLREFLLGTWNRADGRLLIYYAGHGFTDFNQSARADTGYITGSDTPAYGSNSVGAIGKSVSFQEIDALNRETRARQVIMLFDSCFSGSVFLTRSGGNDPRHYDYERARDALHDPVRYYITAGGPSEEIPAASPFAQLILRGLEGEADVYKDGFVTAEELGDYLQRNVPAFAGESLHPQKGTIANARLSSGQFLFLTGLTTAEPPIRGPRSATSRAPLPQNQSQTAALTQPLIPTPRPQRQPLTAAPPPSPFQVPPRPTEPLILPAVAPGVVGPALELGGQRWTITVDGQRLEIEFGVDSDRLVTLSGGQFGSKGHWSATYSVGFQIVTNTHVIQVIFQPRGAQIASCSGVMTSKITFQKYSITRCQRLT